MSWTWHHVSEARDSLIRLKGLSLKDSMTDYRKLLIVYVSLPFCISFGNGSVEGGEVNNYLESKFIGTIMCGV
jgi:hypothetical protein